MSYLLTEKKNYQSIVEKRRKINEIKNNELNKECFDCGSCYPEYISINNGVFICNSCIKIHNKFPKEISLTLKNNLPSLNDKELQYMYFGGNKRLFEFIYNDFPELSKFTKNIFYQTRAMQYYRDNLNYLVNNGPEPIRPSKDINAYELIDTNNERNNKKYERINLEGNKDKGIYKTKKRNKSVGNKKGIGVKGIIFSNNIKKIRKDSRNNKSFKKNHFLDENNVEEELKRHKSFYKEMNKLFKDEDDKVKKGYNYYRKKNNKLISNDINNIKINEIKYNKLNKYNSRTNASNKNKYQEYPIENIYNNNYYNLSTTKNIIMFTPFKDIYDYTPINNPSVSSQNEKLSLSNVGEIYSKPKLSSGQINQNNELFLPLKRNVNKLNLTNIYSYRKDSDVMSNKTLYEQNNNNNYISSNTYNIRNNKNKTKEIFANININKSNLQNNNLIRYIKRNELKKEKEKENVNKRDNYTLRDNNQIQIKEIRIEKIGRKRSTDIFNDISSEINSNISNIINFYKTPSNQNYKKLDMAHINLNKNRYDKRHNIYKDKATEKFLNYTQTENDKSKEKKIKNINIFFDKNRNSNIKKLSNVELNRNTPKAEVYISSKKLEEKIENSCNQKYSIRNRYKLKKKQENF